jgi:hypothetical protein
MSSLAQSGCSRRRRPMHPHRIRSFLVSTNSAMSPHCLRVMSALRPAQSLGDSEVTYLFQRKEDAEKRISASGRGAGRLAVRKACTGTPTLRVKRVVQPIR